MPTQLDQLKAFTTVVADSTGSWSATLSSQAQGAHSYVARQLNSDGTSSRRTRTD